MSKIEFAVEAPEWLKKIEDKEIFSAVYALIASHQIDGKPFTEDGLKEEIKDLGDLDEKQQKEVFDLIMAHNG